MTFSGGSLEFLGGVWKFWGVSGIFGGCLEFLGGLFLQIFGGVFFFFQFLFPEKNSSGMHPPPRDGQCAAGTHPTGMHSCSLKFNTQ